MRKLILIVLLLLPCYGQSQDVPQYARPDVKTAAPYCSCPSQCQAMWAMVPQVLESLTNMRIQTATDSFIQTYGGTMSGEATRTAIDGGYRFDAKFVSQYGNASLEQQALGLFNMQLKGVTISNDCH